MEIGGIFSAFGLSASAGLNAYIPLLLVALLAKFSNLIALKEPWNVLTSWWIIGLLVLLLLVEELADKLPAVNHINDAIQTLIRPTAGAILFAASADVVTEVHPVLALGLGLLVAGSVHAAKSLAVRPAVTATTAGAANAPVSVLEDLTAAMVSFLSILIPIVMGCILIIITSLIVMWIIRRKRKADYLTD